MLYTISFYIKKYIEYKYFYFSFSPHQTYQSASLSTLTTAEQQLKLRNMPTTKFRLEH